MTGGRSATTGRIVKSRLETQKQTFIDPDPFQADQEAVRHSVESVTGATESATRQTRNRADLLVLA